MAFCSASASAASCALKYGSPKPISVSRLGAPAGRCHSVTSSGGVRFVTASRLHDECADCPDSLDANNAPRAAYAISDIVRRAYRCGTNSEEEGWHPSKRLKLLVGGKCTADSRHPDP